VRAKVKSWLGLAHKNLDAAIFRREGMGEVPKTMVGVAFHALKSLFRQAAAYPA
jgi:hypothetical protein